MAHGTDQLYWLARVEEVPTSSAPAPTARGVDGQPPGPEFHTTLQFRSSGADRWQFVARLHTRVLGITDRAGRDAVVVFEDGSWRVFWPGGSSPGAPLPRDGRVISMTSDQRSLWAVGRGDFAALEVATPLVGSGLETPATRDAPTSVPRPSEPPARAAATMPATAESVGAVPPLQQGIFQFAQNEWRLVARLPDELSSGQASLGQVSIGMAGPLPIVIARDTAGEVRVLRLTIAGQLQDVGSLEKVNEFEVINGTTDGTGWISAGSPAGSLVSLTDLGKPPRALAAPDGLSAGDPLAIAFAAGQLRLVFAPDSSGGKILEQTYARDGTPVGAPFALAAAEPGGRENVFEWILFPLMLLITFLVLGPMRRRDAEPVPLRSDKRGSAASGSRANGRRAARDERNSLTAEADDEPDDDDSERQLRDARRGVASPSGGREKGHDAEFSPSQDDSEPVLAPIGLRLLAGLVDGLPLVVLVFVMGVQLRSTSPEDLFDAMRPWRNIETGAMLIWFVHTSVSELLTARTLGKWIFGLRVVDLDGRRPGALALVLRNLLRVVEAALWFPLLAVFFTPFRQRVGDLLARTTVVSNRPPAGRNSSSDDAE